MFPLYLLAAVVLFFLAATLGLILLFLRVRDEPLPLPLGICHGGLALAGLALLVLHVSLARSGGLLIPALALFLLAAFLGFVLLSKHLRGRPQPVRLIVVHGALGFLALVVLLLHVGRLQP